MPHYSPWEERPVNPETGEPAVYYWRTYDAQGNEVRHPRWQTRKKPTAKELKHEPETVWLSISEVAEMVGRCRATVRAWIDEGILPAKQPPKRAGATGRGRSWMINGQHLRDFTQTRTDLVPRTTRIWARK